MELWKTVCEQWDWILFLLFVVKTVVLPATAIWLSVPLVEDPSQTDCTSVCTCTTVCTNCTTVCNRVYNNALCHPKHFWLHIARNKSSTHFNVTTYEAIPTHVPWNASDFAAAAVVIVVLIGLIVVIYNVYKHWTKINQYCRTCFASVNTETVIIFVILLSILYLFWKQLEATRSMDIYMQTTDYRNRLGSTGAN